jgi:hypothetical protein
MLQLVVSLQDIFSGVMLVADIAHHRCCCCLGCLWRNHSEDIASKPWLDV